MKMLRVLLIKELLQFSRNPFMPRMLVVFPLVVMLVIPWVTTMDVKHINVALIDRDNSTLSRRLQQKIESSDYFTLASTPASFNVAMQSLEKGDVDVIVEVPSNFEKSLVNGSPQSVSISANGVNVVKGSLGSQYTVQTVALSLEDFRDGQGLPTSVEKFAVENRFNPTLDYRRYMIPALMIMLIIMLCGFLPALNLVTEKEKGTIEQMNVTPVSRFTFTLAKLIPFWIMGFLVLTVVMLIAWGVYALWPAGSIGVIYLVAALFILNMSGLGVAIANLSDNMQQTMFLMFFFVMIFVLLSGLMTPISSMPALVQDFTVILPPRYFVEVMRSVYLKGTPIADMLPQFASLAAGAIFFNILAALTYRKRS